MAEQEKWYVIHTYSGYEKKVETNIRKLIDNRGLHDQIVDIRVPEEDEVEFKGTERKVVKRKVFPGYVFIKMIMSDSSWHSIRNIRGVTGFVGPESKPVALTDEEIESMAFERKPIEVSYGVGDVVRIIDGPLAGYSAKVLEIILDKEKVKVSVDLFMGRETVVDVDMNQIEPME